MTLVSVLNIAYRSPRLLITGSIFAPHPQTRGSVGGGRAVECFSLVCLIIDYLNDVLCDSQSAALL